MKRRSSATKSGHSLLPQSIATAMAGNRKASYAGKVFGIGAPARLIEAAAAGAGKLTPPIDEGVKSGTTRGSAGVAQLVEHPICNRAVGSSSLSTSTIPSCTSLICQHFMC